jgi:hypothetical protein
VGNRKLRKLNLYLAMSRKPRIFPTTIFIACEGQCTEPNYFERIKEQVEDSGLLAITVYPNKKQKDNKTDAIGLIKECQKKMDVFDEVWAVYDRNGYEKHKEALELANQEIFGKRVQIAFSSISFEIWVLLHFEKSNTCFLKSDCKTEGERYLNCGSNKNQGDCGGLKCVAGFMRSKNYFPTYSKKSNFDIYPHLKDRTPQAIVNAAWLRKKMAGTQEVYDKNPYSTVDFLVKRLIGVNTIYHWGELNEKSVVLGIGIIVSLLQPNVTVQIVNSRDAPIVLNEIKVQLIKEDESVIGVPIKNKVLLIDEINDIIIPITDDVNLISFVIANNQLFFKV